MSEEEKTEKTTMKESELKQVIQDVEHTGRVERREEMAETIRTIVAETGLPINADEAVEDLFSTVRTDLAGYQKMIWRSEEKRKGRRGGPANP